MAPPTPTKKSATLARVRDNQRRCRARKREYVVELERKIQDLQAVGAQTNIENYQNTIERLEAENRKLRELLSRVGFNQSQVEAQLQEGGDTRDWDGGLKLIEGQELSYATGNVDGFPEPVPFEMSTESLPNIFSADDFDNLLDIPLLELAEEGFNFDLSNSALDTGTPPPAPDMSAESTTFPCASLPCDNRLACAPNSSSLSPSNINPRNTVKSDGGTTLCSVAYDLVRQHNNIKLDTIEICMRLWNGFIKGDGDEGCKVENKLLYSVLEYIRG